MTSRDDLIRESLRRPLPLPYHPLYRFYQGGAADPGLSRPARASRRLVVRRLGGLVHLRRQQRPRWPGPGPEHRGSARRRRGHAEEPGGSLARGDGRGVLRRSPRPADRRPGEAAFPVGPVPLHAHPARAWARRHLGSPFGKTEAWILLDTPGDGREPAYAGIGFVPGTSRDLVRRRGAPDTTTPACAARCTAPRCFRVRYTSRTRGCRTTSDRAYRSSRSRSRAITS